MTSQIVLVTRPTDLRHFFTQHTLLYEEIAIDRGSQEPGKTVLPLCHYLKGNWLQWFEDMRWLREGFSPTGPWKFLFGSVKLPSPSAGSLVLYLLWHGLFGASFFRLTSPHALERIEPEIARLLEQTDITMMDVAEARLLRSLYEGVVLPRLLLCWSSI